MEPTTIAGFGHFIEQADVLGKTLLGVLLAMSLVTWCLVVARVVQAARTERHSRAFLQAFWEAPSLHAVVARLAREPQDEAYARLTAHAVAALQHRQRHARETLGEGGSDADFVTRAMRRAIDEETARSESGLTALASIGSTAPFVGLFGTVWGVYHALVNIGLSGQGTLDQVAGPVGEALIMTALGLAVAVPAVLAYNYGIRRNRIFLARLDSFAHDLYSLLTTGTALQAIPREANHTHATALAGTEA